MSIPLKFWLMLIGTWAGLLAEPTIAASAKMAPGATFRDCANCPPMVVVPAGHAVIGSTPEQRAGFAIPPLFSNRESPLAVTIAKPFAVSRFEVTVAEWKRYVHDAKVPFVAGCAGFDAKTGKWPFRPELSWRDPGFRQGADNWPRLILLLSASEKKLQC